MVSVRLRKRQTVSKMKCKGKTEVDGRGKGHQNVYTLQGRRKENNK
jgi:hypothetical protein